MDLLEALGERQRRLAVADQRPLVGGECSCRERVSSYHPVMPFV